MTKDIVPRRAESLDFVLIFPQQLTLEEIQDITEDLSRATRIVYVPAITCLRYHIVRIIRFTA